MKEIILALLGSGGVLVTLIAWLRSHFEKKKIKNKPYSSIAKMTVKLYDTMYRARDVAGVDRFLILRTSNGGGKPMPGHPVFITVEHEVNTDRVRKVKEDFQGIQMDEKYARLINRLDSVQVMEVVTEELDKDSDLYHVYKSDGIEEAFVFWINEGKFLWYGSMSRVEPFTTEQRYIIRNKIKKIVALYRKYEILSNAE